MRQKLSEEKGQALLLALIALAVGALLISPFLTRVSTSLIASRTSEESLAELYSCDAGAEDAIWNLTYSDLATALLTTPGDSISYSLNQSVNDLTPYITIFRDTVSEASDDFESGEWSGGSGWLTPWLHEGSAEIAQNKPGEGTYQGKSHLRLRDDSYVKRALDLSGHSNMRLQFWAKVKGLDRDGFAVCLVSSDGSNWTTVKTWTSADSDDTYHFVDIDLSPYTMSSKFWIAFDAYTMDEADAKLFIDELSVSRLLPGAALGLPWDDFESGNWAGGGGWLYLWSHSGPAYIWSTGSPQQGNYHLCLLPDGYVKRAADLEGLSDLRLQFWAKAEYFYGSDTAECLISSDGSNWTTVKTWTVADSDGAYHFVDIDLSPYAMSAEFWIAFEVDMSCFFYVDDLKIDGPIAYEIVSTAGDESIRADITIQGNKVTIYSWQIK
jgi:hypothetical protein